MLRLPYSFVNIYKTFGFWLLASDVGVETVGIEPCDARASNQPVVFIQNADFFLSATPYS